jgi:hypothetical protein
MIAVTTWATICFSRRTSLHWVSPQSVEWGVCLWMIYRERNGYSLFKDRILTLAWKYREKRGQCSGSRFICKHAASCTQIRRNSCNVSAAWLHILLEFPHNHLMTWFCRRIVFKNGVMFETLRNMAAKYVYLHWNLKCGLNISGGGDLHVPFCACYDCTLKNLMLGCISIADVRTWYLAALRSIPSQY